MNKTIAFIGSGNMGGAIIGGIISAGLVEPKNIIAADPSEKARMSLQEKYGICVTTDNLEAVKDADIIFLAVKPHIYPIVIEQIKDAVIGLRIVPAVRAVMIDEILKRLFKLRVFIAARHSAHHQLADAVANKLTYLVNRAQRHAVHLKRSVRARRQIAEGIKQRAVKIPDHRFDFHRMFLPVYTKLPSPQNVSFY